MCACPCACASSTPTRSLHVVVKTSLHLLCLVFVGMPVQLWLNPTTVDSCGQNPVLGMRGLGASLFTSPSSKQ